MILKLDWKPASEPLPNDACTHNAIYASKTYDGKYWVCPTILGAVYDPVFGRNRFNISSSEIGVDSKHEFYVDCYALVDDLIKKFDKNDLLDKTR